MTETYLSILIPLYRSDRFFDIICDNIRAHLVDGVEILLSDRNGDHAFAGRVRQAFAGQDAVRVMVAEDDADWVSNINGLLQAANGRYVRILPHDDTATLEGSQTLAAALDDAPDAVLAYGPSKTIKMDGTPLREISEQPSVPGTGWEVEDWIDMQWAGKFGGAFKGVVRGDVLRQHQMWIAKTQRTALSERAWLFGLCLLGRFVWVDHHMLTKRRYLDSTSSQFDTEPDRILDFCDTALGYVDRFVSDPQLHQRIRRDLMLNGNLRYARWAGLAGGPKQVRYVPDRPMSDRRAGVVAKRKNALS